MEERQKNHYGENIEIAILYSEPLVRIQFNTVHNSWTIDHYPVDFMSECNSIVNVL